MATLAEQMHAQEFGHVWAIKEGQIVDGPANVYAPEMIMFETDSGTWEDEETPEGWEFLTEGMTGQYGYNGPWMHASEYIGDGMAKAIAERADEFKAFAIVYPSMIALDEDEEVEPGGWAIVGLSI